jgi:hypothetical protein
MEQDRRPRHKITQLLSFKPKTCTREKITSATNVAGKTGSPPVED